MKILMRPTLLTLSAFTRIFKRSLKDENITQDNVDELLYDNQICFIKTENIDTKVSPEKRSANQNHIRGATNSDATIIPSYATAKELLGAPKFRGREIPNPVFVHELFTRNALNSVLGTVGDSTYTRSIPEKIPDQTVLLRLEFDTPVNTIQLGPVNVVQSTYIRLALRITFEDDTEVFVSYVNNPTSLPFQQLSYEKGVKHIEIYKNAAGGTLLYTRFISGWNAPIDSSIGSAYPKNIDTVYIGRAYRPKPDLKQFAYQELEVTHDINNKEAVFMPRPEYLIEASPYLPPTYIQGSVIFEGTKK